MPYYFVQDTLSQPNASICRESNPFDIIGGVDLVLLIVNDLNVYPSVGGPLLVLLQIVYVTTLFCGLTVYRRMGVCFAMQYFSCCCWGHHAYELEENGGDDLSV